MTARFNDWEFDQFRATCANEAIYRAAEERFVEQIHEVIEDGDYDDGYTLWHLMRLAIVENEMRNKRLDERDKARKPQTYRSAAANEHTAKLVPISRSEDPDTARALRELRRDLKAWDEAA